jgi:hypothetical protein
VPAGSWPSSGDYLDVLLLDGAGQPVPGEVSGSVTVDASGRSYRVRSSVPVHGPERKLAPARPSRSPVRVHARPRERRHVARRARARAPSGDDREPEPPLARAFLAQVEALAVDAARLRRRVDGDYSVHLVERVGDRVECLDALVQPTAGELVRDGLPVDEALGRVDARAAELRRLLGRRRT